MMDRGKRLRSGVRFCFKGGGGRCDGDLGNATSKDEDGKKGEEEEGVVCLCRS